MPTSSLTPRERVLRLFRGQEIDRPPCFSGMGNVTMEGIKSLGLRFCQIHENAEHMAKAAATSYKLFGYECAVVPFDLGVEAQLFGCQLNFYPNCGTDEVLYPTIKEKAVQRMEDIKVPEEVMAGRVPMVCQAIRWLKKEIGHEVAIGTYLLGPFTLCGQIMELEPLLKTTFKKPQEVKALLMSLAPLLIKLARVYEECGVDYITLREMGATSDVLSPKAFREVVQPSLEAILDGISVPKVLHICGNSNPIIEAMAQCGADAVSVDQKNNLSQSRAKLGPKALLFGNIDPFNLLVRGSREEVKETVRRLLKDGASALWPGCDLWPTIPAENFSAMMEAVKNSF